MGWSNSTFQLLIITASPSGFSGLFVYSPAPGFGNLRTSNVAIAGTDPYGNAYLGGQTNYFPGPTYIAINMNSGQLSWYTTTSAAGPWGANKVSFFFQPNGTDVLGNSSLELAVTGAIDFNYIGGTSGSILSQGGGLAPGFVGSIAAINPVGGLTPGIEILHTPAYNAGWADGGTGSISAAGGIRFFLGADRNSGMVYVQGVFNQTSATPSGTTFTLPASYRPASQVELLSHNFNGATASADICSITTGGAFVVNVFPGNGNVVVIGGQWYRLAA